MQWPVTIFLGVLAAGAPALAQDSESSEYEEEFDFLMEGEKNAALIAATKGASADEFSAYDEDDEEFEEFQLKAQPAKAAPRLPYSIAGKPPMGNNYEASVVFAERDAIVVELPVLVARSPADFKGAGFWIVGEAVQNGTVLAASRQQVTNASLAQSGPTVAFVKLLVPVSAAEGEVEVRISRLDQGQSTPSVLFSRSVSYQLRR